MHLNHQFLYHLQEAFYVVPDLTDSSPTQSFASSTNDQILIVFLSNLLRALLVIALHALVDNKPLGKLYLRTLAIKSSTYAQILRTAFLNLVLCSILSNQIILCPIRLGDEDADAQQHSRRCVAIPS